MTISSNKWLLVFLLFFPFTLTAQGEYSYQYGIIPDGQATYLFGDNVNIREAPTTTAKSIGKLKAGTPVTVLSNGGSHRVNGLDARWYEVQAGKVKGWVWGGLLALTATSADDGLLMYGLTAFSPDSGFTGEVRYIKGGRTAASIPITPFHTSMGPEQEYNYSVKNTLTPSAGLDNVRAVWELEFLYEACGYESGSKYVAWTGNQLFFVAAAPYVSEAGQFHFETDLIFPWEEGGKLNKVICRTELSEFDEKIEDYKVTEAKEDILSWNGQKFIRQAR